MDTLGGDLQPGCLADRLLTGLGHPQINPEAQKEKEKVFGLRKESIKSWLLTYCSKKDWAADKFSRQGLHEKEEYFLVLAK
jgi:hypothetical protein